MCWNYVKKYEPTPTCTRKDAFHVEEELFVSDETDRIAKILYTNYKPANVKELTEILQQLNCNQKEQLHALIDKQRGIFYSALGLWKGSLYKIEL